MIINYVVLCLRQIVNINHNSGVVVTLAVAIG
jgi:hypothetical protein